MSSRCPPAARGRPASTSSGSRTAPCSRFAGSRSSTETRLQGPPASPHPAGPMAAPNDQVSHYRLIEPLGHGGMGQAWLAEDTSLPRRVVVKLLHPHLAADDTASARLLREARATASIDHPNVLTVYEAGV